MHVLVLSLLRFACQICHPSQCLQCGVAQGLESNYPSEFGSASCALHCSLPNLLSSVCWLQGPDVCL